MNKAVPWNVKGVGFSAREVAHMAARRAGVPIGEWLNSVITDRAKDLGVSMSDFSEDERLDALVARLAGVAESLQPEEDRTQVRKAPLTRGETPARSTGADSMAQVSRNDDAIDSGGGTRKNSRPTRSESDALPWTVQESEDRGSRRKLEEWDGDVRLDQALELAEKRAAAADDRVVGERQRLAVAALAKEVDRLNRLDRGAPASRQATARSNSRSVEADHPGRSGEGSRPIREVVGSVAERIEAMEARIAHRDADLANRPIVAALSRLEDRFEHLLRRNVDGARESAKVEATFRELDGRLRDIAQRLDRNEHALPARSVADIERIDGSLAAILSRFDAAPEPAAKYSDADRWKDAPHVDTRPGRKNARDAVAEITRRQADLDQSESHRSALLRGTSYPSIGQAQRDGRGTRDLPDAVGSNEDGRPESNRRRTRVDVSDMDLDPVAGLQDQFARLTERMEARLDEAARTRAKLEDRSEDITALKSGIAALGERLDDIKRQNEDDRLFKEENDGVEVLRQEIAALQVGLAKLAPQSAISTLENAVRELGGQIDESRRDGVSDAVLAPLDRLRQEIRQTLDGNLKSAIGGVEQQLQGIGGRLGRLETNALDQEAAASLQGQMQDVRDLLRTAAAHFQAADRLQAEVVQLGTRVERLAEGPPRSAVRDLELSINEIRTMLVEFSPENAVQDVSRKLDRFAERMDVIEEHVAAPTAMFDEFSRRIEVANASLAERLLQAAPATVDLAPIEAMIGGLSTKIDGLRHASADTQVLGGLVRGLAAQIEEARLPSADARILDTLETQVGRLAERLDRSDASLDAITSVERLVRDLFGQIDETRTAAIDAAEAAARTAAQETLRAALVSPTLAGEEASARATRVVEQVGQELSEFRKAHKVSEQRVHSTLLALNDTLERMVDRMVVEAEKARPKVVAAAPGIGDAPVRDNAAPPERKKADDAPAVATALPLAEPRELSAKPVDVKIAPGVRASIPSVEIGRAPHGDPIPDVSPLIAAARRAAQAAQLSASTASRSAEERVRAESPTAKSGTKGWRAVMAQKRPILLSVASVLLLLGALQIVRMTQGRSDVASMDHKDTVEASAEPTAPAAVSPPPPAALAATPKVAVDAAPVSAPAPVAVASTSPQVSSEMLSGDTTQTQATVSPPVSASLETAESAPKALAPSLRDLADHGDPSAQYEIGARYTEGRSLPRNPKSAVTWFERAGKQGFAPAEYRLGSIYEKGTGAAADPAQAIAWYEKAANQGNVRAMHNLAVMAAEGAAGKSDYDRAATWFTKAANHGVRDSQYNLAILYARGLGVPQDLSQSYTWFSLAAAQGDADAGKKRDDVAAKLDASKLASAKAAVDAFKPDAVEKLANEVVPPVGGWEVAAPVKSTSPKISTM